jgi:HlyD family secretion protein
MDGTISSLGSEVGERVVGTGSFAGTEIMRVADLGQHGGARQQVNENDIVNVKLGDKATISIDAYPGRKFSGTSRRFLLRQGTGATGSGQPRTDEVTNFLVKIRISRQGRPCAPA